MKEKINSIKQYIAKAIFKIKFSIIFSFFFLIILTSGSIIVYTYSQYMDELSMIIDQRVQNNIDFLSENFTHFLQDVSKANHSSAWLITDVNDFQTRRETIISHVIGLLELNKQINQFVIGLETGSLMIVTRFKNGRPTGNREMLDMSLQDDDTTAYQLIYIQKDITPVKAVQAYYNKDGIVIAPDSDFFADISYDLRKVSWYMNAKKLLRETWTNIYRFYKGTELGVTVSHPIYDKNGRFIGACATNVIVQDLSEFFQSKIQYPIANAFLFDKRGFLVAYPDIDKLLRYKSDTFTVESVGNIEEYGINKLYKQYKENGKPAEIAFVNQLPGHEYPVYSYFVDHHKKWGPSWVMCVIVTEDQFIANIDRISQNSFVFSFIMLILAILLMIIISKKISWPIEQTANELRNIKVFDFSKEFAVTSKFIEIADMLSVLKGVKIALASFMRFVPKSIAKQLISGNNIAQTTGDKRQITVMFSDIAGFTTLTEDLVAEKLLQHLSEYFECNTQIIDKNNGVVDKYIGDGIMALWGAPDYDQNSAEHACRAALQCIDMLYQQNQKWEEEDKPKLNNRFGIANGYALVGTMGSADRIQYTALGNVVNLASRLEEMNKHYGTRVLVTEEVVKKTKEQFIFRPVDLITVKGKVTAVTIYELLAEYQQEHTKQSLIVLANQALRTSRAWDSYLSKNWPEAMHLYSEILVDFPTDPVATLFKKRCEQFIATPPDQDWDCVTHFNVL